MGAIRSIKKRPFCWQDKEVMRLIRKSFTRKRMTTAITIYQSLTELASNQGKDSFSAYVSQIAELSGKSNSTIRIYCKEFIQLELLEKRFIKKNDKINLANQWSLLKAPSFSDSYSTSLNNDPKTSFSNYEGQKEEILLEKNNKNSILKFSETEGYKKLKERVKSFRRTPYA